MDSPSSLVENFAMSSRVVLTTVVALLGLLALCLPLRRALGDDTAKAKPAETEQPKELTPKSVTLQEKEITVGKALAELAKQTGNQVEDRRQSKDKDTANIKLDLKNVTFWQALDTIAKEADARVSLYERDGKLALLDGPHQVLPVSYSGLFRVTVKRIDLNHLLESDTRTCVIYLEVAWEPRFQPLFMETRPDSLVVQDDKGRALETPEGGKGLAGVAKRLAADIQVRLPAPKRSAAHLGLFKGKLAAMGASKMLTFTFDKLAKVEKATEARKETQGGVTVHLRELRPEGQGDDQIWTIGFLLEYPADGPKFESFQSWLGNNEIYLEKEKNGIKQRFPPNLGEESGDQSENKALVRYRFGDEPEKNLVLGKISDWKLVYRTPGKISEVPIPFEFKDLPLP
jgi:hypothetical protein